MTAAARTPPIFAMELGGSGLAGARHLRDEREKRRRAQATRPQQAAPSFAESHYGDTSHSPSPPAPKVSPRQRKRIEDTHAYLCAKVDPVMGPLILSLVAERPEDIREAALQHFLSRKNQGGDGTASRVVGEAGAGDGRREEGGSLKRQQFERKNSDSAVDHHHHHQRQQEGHLQHPQQRLAKRKDRLFMAIEIGPLISELINRTLRRMPIDVESFLVEQLQGVATPAEESANRSKADYRNKQGLPGVVIGEAGNNNEQPHRPTRPSTARSRLQQAQSLDQHVQQTSPPLTERTERRSPSPPRTPEVDGGGGGGGGGGGRLSDELDGDGNVERREGGGGGWEAKAGEAMEGVTESRNKPWDVEVSSKATLPPADAESPAPVGGGGNTPPGSKAPQLAVVLLLGLDGAGKTTLLGTLQGEHNPKVRPSVGFKPVTMMLSDQLKVKFYDLGGGKNIRSIWDKYYHDAHGLLYVVDGADIDRWAESKELFLAATGHRYLRDKPIAVILNKEDEGMQLRPEEVADDLGISAGVDVDVKVCCCSANTAKASGGVPDERLDGAVEWLLERIQGSFAELNARVQRDLQAMDREFQREKVRKQLGVLKGLLRKAFPAEEGADKEDCFDETEGLEFLTSEVGLEAGMLTAEGAEIAALVGYQKLALQMIGNMKSPISRKNRARSWGEIRELIVSLREEAGIEGQQQQQQLQQQQPRS